MLCAERHTSREDGMKRLLSLLNIASLTFGILVGVFGQPAIAWLHTEPRPFDGRWNALWVETTDDFSGTQVGQSTFDMTIDDPDARADEIGAGEKSWHLSGFLRNGYLSLSYTTKGKGSTGIGSIMLTRVNGNHPAFIGTWIGRDSANGKIVRCPMVLTRDTPQEVRDEWASFLSKPCEVLSADLATTDGIIAHR